MRIRSTKPEFWRSKTIAALPWDVRLVLKGLESYVDDNGVGKDDVALIAADVFPRDLSGSPRETLARLTEAVSLLSEHGLITRYEADGDDLLYIDRWSTVQRIDKPAKGRFRRPDGTLDYAEPVNRESYASPREDFGNPRAWNRGTGEQGNRGTDQHPCASADAERVHRTSDAQGDAQAFEAFWAAYPRKRSKATAAKAYARARKTTSAEDILLGLKRVIPEWSRRQPDKVPYAATWLNAQGWLDQLDTPPPAPAEDNAWMRMQPDDYPDNPGEAWTD